MLPLTLTPPPPPRHPRSTCSGAEPPTELFAPAFSLAVCPDPLLAAAGSSAGAGGSAAAGGAGGPAPAPDVFLAVGLDSGLQEFRRPRLNLAILLDVSGSMSGERSFQRRFGGKGAGSSFQLFLAPLER